MVLLPLIDSSPLVTYYPTGGWNSRSASKPLPSTFHDGTFYPLPGITNFPNVPLTASIVFNGTAVYVFCALAQIFYIDGSLKDTFVKIAPGNNDTYNYSVNVFSIDSLIPGSHNLTLQNGQVNGFKSLMLLDEIVYTTVNNFTLQSPTSTTTPSFSAQTSTSSDSSSSIRSHRIVVGLAIAVPVIAVLLAALGLIFFLKQRKQRYEKSGTSPRPFEPTAARTIEPFLTLPHSNLSHPMSSIPSQQTHPSNRFHAGLSGAHRAYAPTELQASGYTSSIPGVTSEEQPSPRHALTSRSVGGGFGSNQAPPSYANLSGLEPPPAYDMSKAA
ncbi:hypothetical protein DFJ43DRAFT_1099838 [Lentinula guzmanii]|uniref:Uncharacterized protein n=1 Tax=Lentinula guzmanii TaxID=2804957 RepID=A0AA38J3N8_9AGAR|nr:hypothetical protein DFJ43DRAFT_1099838 [Lentinula guzmanii]